MQPYSLIEAYPSGRLPGLRETPMRRGKPGRRGQRSRDVRPLWHLGEIEWGDALRSGAIEVKGSSASHLEPQVGAKVADVGCGLGASSVIMAQAYPASAIGGSDYHEASIKLARKRAADAGVLERIAFEVASAQTFSGTGYDLVATFDCLHDMGDPLSAARHVREALSPEGTWLIVEPAAADTVEGNLNPVGRMYYSFSSFLCVPNGLSQPGGYALGAALTLRNRHSRRVRSPYPP